MKFRSALVLGMGESGLAAARLLQSEGSHVCACDTAEPQRVEQALDTLRADGVDVFAGRENLPDGPFDICVVSPGFAADARWLRQARQNGWRIISELELGFSRLRIPCLAVTGTNGKSTCVKLAAEIMTAAGMRVSIGGNYGTALCRIALEQENLDWAVVEVSSFQLEHVDTFCPQVGVVLNVQPDHLDRHGSMEEYRRVKSRLLTQMGAGQSAVVHAPESDFMKQQVTAAKGGTLEADMPEWITFGVEEGADVKYRPGSVLCEKPGGVSSVSLVGSPFDNPVMGLTAAAVTAAVQAAGVAADVVFESVLHDFAPLPHRVNMLGQIGGVAFVEDSKATNLAALEAALEMVPFPVHLIAGGRLKEGALGRMKEKLCKHVRCVYCIGEAAKAMEEAWSGAVPVKVCGDLETAFTEAVGSAVQGEAVLLSPGCASFDQFGGFAQRGNEFKKLFEARKKEPVRPGTQAPDFN